MTSTSSSAPNILFVAHNPHGGAGLAAHRLFTALKEKGIPVRFLVLEGHRPGVQLWDEPTDGHPPSGIPRKLSKIWTLTKAATRAVARWWRTVRQDRFLQNSESSFEILTLYEAGHHLGDHPWFAWADVVHLHWTAGFLSSRQPWQKKKWILSLHDCHPFTAVCHFPGDCREFTQGCSTCPQLRGTRNPHFSGARFQKKQRGYQALENAWLHAPSQWMADQAAQSSLLGRVPRRVLSNLLPTQVFRPLDRRASRDWLGLPADPKIALFVAGFVSNQRKGFSWFSQLAERYQGSDWLFVLVGGGDLPALPPNCLALGVLTDVRLMAAAYSAANVFLSTSIQDNQPSTLAEAQLCGTPVVGFAAGGQAEMVDQGLTGWLSPDLSVDSLALGLQWVEKTSPSSNAIAQWAHGRWNQEDILARWLEFYRSLV